MSQRSQERTDVEQNCDSRRESDTTDDERSELEDDKERSGRVSQVSVWVPLNSCSKRA